MIRGITVGPLDDAELVIVVGRHDTITQWSDQWSRKQIADYLHRLADDTEAGRKS